MSFGLPRDALAAVAIAIALGSFALAPTPWVAAPAALVFAAAVYWQPRYGLAAILATLPTYFHAPELAGLALSLPELGLLLTTAAVAARALRRGDAAPHPTRFDWWIALFLLASLLSLLPTEYLRLSLRALRTLVLEPVLFYYLVITLCPEPRALRSLLVGFLGGALAVAALAVGQVLLNVHAVDVEGVRRALGTFPSPNHLGLYLGRALPFAVAGALWAPRWRRGFLALALALALALVLTFSGGAWLGAAASLLVLAALAGRRWLVTTALACSALAAVALVVLVRLGAERIVGQATLGGTTATSRRLIWTSALAMIRDHPLLGIGLDNFLYRYQLEYMLPAAWAEPNMSHPHNWLLQFWLDLGLLGLVAFGGLLATFFWAILRQHKQPRQESGGSVRTIPDWPSPLVAAALASMVGWLVHGAVDNSYFLLDQAYLFWWQLAIVEIAGRVGRNRAG